MPLLVLKVMLPLDVLAVTLSTIALVEIKLAPVVTFFEKVASPVVFIENLFFVVIEYLVNDQDLISSFQLLFFSLSNYK